MLEMEGKVLEFAKADCRHVVPENYSCTPQVFVGNPSMSLADSKDW